MTSRPAKNFQSAESGQSVHVKWKSDPLSASWSDFPKTGKQNFKVPEVKRPEAESSKCLRPKRLEAGQNFCYVLIRVDLSMSSGNQIPCQRVGTPGSSKGPGC